MEDDYIGAGLSLAPIILKKKPNKLTAFFIKHGWKKNININIDTSERSIKESYVYLAKELFYKTKHVEFKDKLYSIGLRKITADKLYFIIKKLIDTCYTDKQLFDICLDYTLGRYTAIRPDADFLQQIKILNSWLKITNQTHYMFNMTYDFIDTQHMLNTLPNLPDLNSHTLFYHTTNWKTYVSICDIGILLSKSRLCLDFGITPSFYMTSDYKVSEDYGLKYNDNWENEVCVLIFKVPNKLNLNIKKFVNTTKEWKKLVKSSRMCEDEYNDLDRYDFVYGPMVANPKQVANGESEPVSHNILKYQLASKSDKSNELLINNFLGCIFFDKKYYKK